MRTTLIIGALLGGLSALQIDPAFARWCFSNADCDGYCTAECQYGFCSVELNPLDSHCICEPRGSTVPCSSDGNPCSWDHCFGGNCTHDDPNPDNLDIVCRPAADVCDAPDYCEAFSTTCKVDGKQPNGTVCRPAFFECDAPEYCSYGVCPSNTYRPAGWVCRSASGDCDAVETCDGTSRYCPDDQVEAAGVVCRASGGSCDVAEVCNGTSVACPSDQVKASGVVCNPSSGSVCDLDDICNGTNKYCPNRAQTRGLVCRAATDVCDLTETCDGYFPDCPPDKFRPQTFTCRGAVDACDRAESCTGTSAACPVDLKQQDGTPCPDGEYCDGVETCQSGVCTDSAQGGPCGLAPCEETSDQCLTDQCPTQPQTCQTAGKGVLVVKNNTDDAKDKLIWKFVNGTTATTRDDFADPTDSASYVLCLYSDAASATPEAVAIPIPPDASRWQPLGDKGYKYFDDGGTQGAAQKVIVKSGDVGKTKALVKGGGVELPAILDSGALALPVEVQLFNYATSKCWDTTFTAPDDNSDLRFKAKNF